MTEETATRGLLSQGKLRAFEYVTALHRGLIQGGPNQLLGVVKPGLVWLGLVVENLVEFLVKGAIRFGVTTVGSIVRR